MMRSWLWPDRTIGKKESRNLREEHNRTVLVAVRALDCLTALLNTTELNLDEVEPETEIAIVEARYQLDEVGRYR